MNIKKFFAKLLAFEQPTGKELENLSKKEIEEATSDKEIIEEPTQKPLSKEEMEEVLKPLDEAKAKAEEESAQIRDNKDL